MKQKILTMILLASLTVSMLTGCGQTETASTVDTQTTETTAQPEEPEQAEEVVAETTETEVASAEEPEATTESSTEEVTPEPTEETTEEPEPEYTYTDMNATMYAQQTVNVRDLPDTSGNKLGSLSTNDEIKISGQCNETGWYMFEYNDSVAFVSNKYIGENKVEVQQQVTANNGSEQAQAPSTPASNYEKNVWYDMGEYFFIMCNSQEEADNYYMSCFDNHDDYNIRATLQSRYPDRHTYVIGRPNYVTLVVAVYPTAEGFPNWSTITNYVPEVSMR